MQQVRSFNGARFSFFQWLGVINIAVIYNLIFVIGRSVFWNLQGIGFVI